MPSFLRHTPELAKLIGTTQGLGEEEVWISGDAEGREEVGWLTYSPGSQLPRDLVQIGRRARLSQVWKLSLG